MNKKAMIAAIKADGALCAGGLVSGRVLGCGHVGRCAIGALLFHGGMTNRELREASSDPYRYMDGVYWMDSIHAKGRKIFTEKYELLDKEIRKTFDTLIQTNDDFAGAWRRYGKREKGKSLKQWRARARAVIAAIRVL